MMLSGLAPNVPTLAAVRPTVSITVAELMGVPLVEMEMVLPLRSEMLVGRLAWLCGKEYAVPLPSVTVTGPQQGKLGELGMVAEMGPSPPCDIWSAQYRPPDTN